MEYIDYTQFNPEKLSFKVIKRGNKYGKGMQYFIIPLYEFSKNKIKRFVVKWPFLPIQFSYSKENEKEKPWMNGFRFNLNDCEYPAFIKMLQEYDKKFTKFVKYDMKNEVDHRICTILQYKKMEKYGEDGKNKEVDIIKCIYPRLMKSRKEKGKFTTEIINYNTSVFKDICEVLNVYELADIVKIFEYRRRKANEKEGRLLMTFRSSVANSDRPIFSSYILPYKIELKDKGVKIQSVIDKNEIKVEPQITKVII